MDLASSHLVIEAPYNEVFKQTPHFLKSMDEEEQKYCLDIMEKILVHPCSKPFMEPTDDKEEGMELYYSRIRSPMDLNQIKGKLLTNEYDDIKDWKRDMALIWTNAERFYGSDSYMPVVAREFSNIFLKLTEEEDLESMRTWSKEAFKAYTEFEEVISQAPKSLKKNCTTVIKLRAIPNMPIRYVERLMKASKELKNKSDAREMMKIIARYNPELAILSKDVQIDIDHLSPATHWALEKYMKKRYQQMGMSFPL